MCNLCVPQPHYVWRSCGSWPSGLTYWLYTTTVYCHMLSAEQRVLSVTLLHGEQYYMNITSCMHMNSALTVLVYLINKPNRALASVPGLPHLSEQGRNALKSCRRTLRAPRWPQPQICIHLCVGYYTCLVCMFCAIKMPILSS